MKAQISIDFMITLALLMILFLFVFEVAMERNNFDNDRIYELQAKSKANTLARIINAVYQADDGTKVLRDFGQALQNNRAYNMTINAPAYRIEIRWDSHFYSAPIQAADIIGSQINGTVTIRNAGGIIYVE